MRTEKLGDLAEFRNGLNYTDADNGSGLAMVGVSDFKDRVVVDTGNLPQLSPSALSKQDALIQEGDILFVRSNGNRELIGRSVYVNTEPAMPTSHSGFTIRCRFHDRRCCPRYYAYLFRGSIIRQILSAQGGGTNISNLNQQILADLDVPVPNRSMQERVAGILSAYDDLIEVNLRRIAILEDMARRLFDEWFVRFRYPGHEAVPLVETELGLAPKGWAPARLGSLLTLSYGKALKADHRRTGPVPVFGSSGIVGEHDKHLVQGPGIIVGRKGNVGSVHWSSHDFYPIDTVFFVETNMPLRWIYQLLKRQTFLNSDAAVPGLNREQAYAMKVLRPDPEPVGGYSQLVEPLFQQLELLTLQNSKLRAARDLLLPKLISGEIDVSTAEETFAEAAE